MSETPTSLEEITETKEARETTVLPTDLEIKLESKEGKKISVSKKKAIALSVLIKTSLESDPEATEVPLPGVKYDTLVKIIDFINLYDEKNPLKLVTSVPFIDEQVDKKYFNFISRFDNKNVSELIDLINAANYLDMPALISLSTAQLANIIMKNKNNGTEELAKILGVKSDLGSKEITIDQIYQLLISANLLPQMAKIVINFIQGSSRYKMISYNDPSYTVGNMFIIDSLKDTVYAAGDNFADNFGFGMHKSGAVNIDHREKSRLKMTELTHFRNKHIVEITPVGSVTNTHLPIQSNDSLELFCLFITSDGSVYITGGSLKGERAGEPVLNVRYPTSTKIDFGGMFIKNIATNGQFGKHIEETEDEFILRLLILDDTNRIYTSNLSRTTDKWELNKATFIKDSGEPIIPIIIDMNADSFSINAYDKDSMYQLFMYTEKPYEFIMYPFRDIHVKKKINEFILSAEKKLLYVGAEQPPKMVPIKLQYDIINFEMMLVFWAKDKPFYLVDKDGILITISGNILKTLATTDMKEPDKAEYEIINLNPKQTGGYNKYHHKYLKYKQKYLNLKAL